MSILKKRCPRCKREVKVHAVYSRSDYGNTVMRVIENQYQCSVCGLCFKFRAPVVPVVLHNNDDDAVSIILGSNNADISDQCQQYLSERYDALPFEQLDCNMFLYLKEKTGLQDADSQLLCELWRYLYHRQRTPIILDDSDDEVKELVTMSENEGKVN